MATLIEEMKMEAREYALHHFAAYEHRLLNQEQPFEQHLIDTCQFNSEFFEDLFYKYYDEVAEEYPNAVLEELEGEILQRIEDYFLLYFKKEYIQFIHERLQDTREQVAFEEESYRYYKTREYIEAEGEHALSEEERRSCMQEAEKSTEFLLEKLDAYSIAIKEIKRSNFKIPL